MNWSALILSLLAAVIWSPVIVAALEAAADRARLD